MYGINARSLFFLLLLSVSLMLSSSNKRPVCGIFSKSRKRNVMMCEKQVFWRINMWKTRGRGWEWRITSGIWICLKRNEAQVRLLLCERDTLTDRQGIRRWWERYTPNDKSVKHCIIVWNGINLEPPGPESELLFHQGKWLWSPRSSTLWSVHPVMNGVAVKGWKAGVHAYVCLWEYTLLNSVCATNNQI